MAVDVSELEGLINKWQIILRLMDWDIKLQIVDKEWRKSGDIKIDIDDKKAVMLINNNPKSTNLEELVVHELLHLKLWGMDQMIEGFINGVFGANEDDIKKDFAMNQFFILLESTVEDLTKGFLKANGCDQELSFGRLQKLIDNEIGC
ncbi:hypothetical protein LGL55_16210 [Clostridium tagluense]|uniref:hypothetical protein n=1 Tax=Clostridium tagluense TaxID=360422 RepID=UPI001C0D22B8|nr:hypothetical protein [Clostridium tagluense]MBU3128665.1 hypothetical protein [Clostridium tagluense]MCB2312781.1 hypothetical protein [Clostridium tagluense]MCB2317547.1 hypothetical protein [Clostridium tagluense]MCB2322363.1 hypothetical protein [Clostridium tagluense]MCB2327366.1 hypothetical protein [Clostridium tagluense]